MREKLDGQWKKYVNSVDKDALRAAASASEEWLYTEEGEEANKSQYVERLDALKALGDPIHLRYREHEERPRASAHLREVLSGFQSKATSGDAKFAHLAEKDLQTVIETCANAEAWIGNKLASQAEKPLDVKPVVTSAEIRKRAEECVPAVVPRPRPSY